MALLFHNYVSRDVLNTFNMPCIIPRKQSSYCCLSFWGYRLPTEVHMMTYVTTGSGFDMISCLAGYSIGYVPG